MKKGTKNDKLRLLVFSALLAAVIAVATMIRIPAAKGYINLGDTIVIIVGWMLGPAYGFASAGIGSMLTDIFSGYIIYAPASFIIKGLMATLSYFTYKWLSIKAKSLPSRIISAIFSEIIMILGYFVYETIIYGSAIAIVGLSSNVVQGVFGIVGSVLLYEIILKRIPQLQKIQLNK